MKKLIAVLAVACLSGCAYYGPYGSPYSYYGNSPYYSGYYGTPYSPYYYGAPYYGGTSSVFIYGGGGFAHRDDHRHWRDHRGDGARFNRDRDRDGVPNWRDAHPRDPTRR